MSVWDEPYYEDDHVVLHNLEFTADVAMDLMDSVGPSHFDAVITDPPYGETSLEWDVWPDGWPSAVAMLSDTLWCFGSFRMFFDRAPEFGMWSLAQDIVWEKHNGSGFRNDRFKRVHEHAVHFYQGRWDEQYHVAPTTPDAVRKTVRSKTSPPHLNPAKATTYTSEDGGDRLMRSVIKLRSMHGSAINETEKPVALVRTLIESSVPPGGVVLDPFSGSASTGIAARQSGRKAVLFEKRESQCESAARRLERDTAQPFDLSNL